MRKIDKKLSTRKYFNNAWDARVSNKLTEIYNNVSRGREVKWFETRTEIFVYELRLFISNRILYLESYSRKIKEVGYKWND